MELEHILLSCVLGACGFLAIWLIHNVQRRLDAHSKNIDELFKLIRDLTITMAENNVKRPEFEAKVRQLEAKIDKLYMDWRREK